MRRTDTLRVFVVDRSVLAKNMYTLLFQDLSGYRLEFGEDGAGLAERKRRARPHVVLANANAFPSPVDPRALSFVSEYPTVLLASPDRTDLKEFGRAQDGVTLIEKPFYPYDLITVLNRAAGLPPAVKLRKQKAAP